MLYLYILIKPFLPNIVYWTAPAKDRVISTKIKKHSVSRSSKNLTQRDEFLLTLMRLRLGIINEDLADRLLRQLLGHALVVWLPREAVRQNLPNVFKKAVYSNCRVILDCAENL